MLNIFLSQEGSSLSHSKLIPAQPLGKKKYFAKLCQTVEREIQRESRQHGIKIHWEEIYLELDLAQLPLVLLFSRKSSLCLI